MRNDQFPDQFPQPKIDIISINKPYYIYYSHSISYCNTQQEKNNLKFLRSKKFEIINPNGLGLGKEMYKYLFKVELCDAVWYRGDTIGVALEVITALAMKKPVYSLKTRKKISRSEIAYLVNIYQNNAFIGYDLALFEKVFPYCCNAFERLIKGEML